MKVNKPFTIGILGPIGVGKSTLSKLLSKRLKIKHIEEKFPNNPFLGKFYKDPKRWSFDSQLHFFLSKVEQLKKLNPNESYVIDPSLEMDVIYALTQAKMGWMNLDEKNMYLRIAKTLKQKYEIKTPDLILRLRAPFKTLGKRISKRKRPYEMDLIKPPALYLKVLDKMIDKYISQNKRLTIIQVDASGDSFTSNLFLKKLELRIRRKLLK